MASQRDIDRLHASREVLVAALTEAGATKITRTAFRCPAHDDRSPSGSIYEENGVWRAQCKQSICGQSGDAFDWLAWSRNTSVEDLLQEIPEGGDPWGGKAKHFKAEKDEIKYWPSIEALTKMWGYIEHYEYVTANGDPVLVVVKRKNNDGKKFFTQLRPDGDGFINRAPDGPLPMLNLPAIVEADYAIVVEGEKCADTLGRFGFVATTCAGGSSVGASGLGAADKTDWSPLAGKRVLLWPDNDQAGVDHMERVKEKLLELDPKPKVKWLDPAITGVPLAGDVADLIALYAENEYGQQKAVIQNCFKQAREVGVQSLSRQRLQDILAGKFRSEQFSHRALSRGADLLKPGSVVAIAGSGGAAKSLFLTQEIIGWLLRDVKVACYMLENDRGFHTYRAFAQLAGNSRLGDANWIEANPDRAARYLDAHEYLLERIERVFTDSPIEAPTLDALAEWVQVKAAGGSRIIIIDPVTMAVPTAKPWVSDHAFLVTVKRAALDYGCTVILVTHNKKGKLMGDLDDLAGGAAYARFCEGVLWIERPNEDIEAVVIQGKDREEYLRINRLIEIRKTRHGPAAGKGICFFFDGRTTRFHEFGFFGGKASDGQHCTKPWVNRDPLDGVMPDLTGLPPEVMPIGEDEFGDYQVHPMSPKDKEMADIVAAA